MCAGDLLLINFCIYYSLRHLPHVISGDVELHCNDSKLRDLIWDRQLPFFAKVLFHFLSYMCNILCTIDNKVEFFCSASGDSN